MITIYHTSQQTNMTHVELHTSDGHIICNKQKLMSLEYFSRMLCSNMKESTLSKIVLPQANITVLTEVYRHLNDVSNDTDIQLFVWDIINLVQFTDFIGYQKLHTHSLSILKTYINNEYILYILNECKNFLSKSEADWMYQLLNDTLQWIIDNLESTSLTFIHIDLLEFLSSIEHFPPHIIFHLLLRSVCITDTDRYNMLKSLNMYKIFQDSSFQYTCQVYSDLISQIHDPAISVLIKNYTTNKYIDYIITQYHDIQLPMAIEDFDINDITLHTHDSYDKTLIVKCAEASYCVKIPSVQLFYTSSSDISPKYNAILCLDHKVTQHNRFVLLLQQMRHRILTLLYENSKVSDKPLTSRPLKKLDITKYMDSIYINYNVITCCTNKDTTIFSTSTLEPSFLSFSNKTQVCDIWVSHIVRVTDKHIDILPKIIHINIIN